MPNALLATLQKIDAEEAPEDQSFAPKAEIERPSATYAAFIAGGEEVASVLERHADFFEQKAGDYRRLAKDARAAATKEAEDADKWELRIKKVTDIFVE